MTRRVLAILAAVALGTLSTGGCGLFGGPTVAMVSGRDDHGLLERPAIGLQRSPTDRAITGTAHDGEFVRVLRRDGPWAYVALIRGADEGWIEDHYLRGEAVNVGATPRRVRFVAAEPADGGVRVRVRYNDDGSEQWVPATSLREVGAR